MKVLRGTLRLGDGRGNCGARVKIAGERDSSSMAAELLEIARRLAEAGRRFDARGWVPGTSGNFSAVITRDPLRLAITAQRRVERRSHRGRDSRAGCRRKRRASGSAAAIGRNAPASRDRPRSRRRRRAAHALAVEHAAVRSPCRGRRPRHRGLRDAEGPRGRGDARAPGVDSDSRERPGHGPAGRPGAATRSTAIRRATRSCFAATACTPGERRCPQAVRHVEIARVPARGVRPERRLTSWRSSESRQRTPRSPRPAQVRTFLAAHGIEYQRWTADRPVGAEADADAVLAAYGPEIDDAQGERRLRHGRRDRRQARDARPRRDAGEVQPRALARRRRGALHRRRARPVSHSSARRGRSSRSRSRPAI